MTNYIKEEQGWSAISIAAFVASFFVPAAGIILGIVALLRHRKSRRNGRSLAIAAIVIGGLLSAFLVIGMLSIFTLQPSQA